MRSHRHNNVRLGPLAKVVLYHTPKTHSAKQPSHSCLTRNWPTGTMSFCADAPRKLKTAPAADGVDNEAITDRLSVGSARPHNRALRAARNWRRRLSRGHNFYASRPAA